MLLNNFGLKVQLYKQPVDMRKSIDGLSMIVADSLSSDPCDGKRLITCPTGLCRYYKAIAA